MAIFTPSYLPYPSCLPFNLREKLNGRQDAFFTHLIPSFKLK